MRMRQQILIVFMLGLFFSLLISCDSKAPEPQTQITQHLTFDVNADLLGPEVVDSSLHITLSPPRNWNPIPEEALTQVKVKSKDILGQTIELEPCHIFGNEQSRTMCFVSRLRSLNIDNFETLMEDLKKAYYSKLKDSRIDSATYFKDEFMVHQLMVNTSQYVLIKLFLDSPDIPVFEVDYVVPLEVYGKELRAIESSIGSIRTLKNI